MISKSIQNLKSKIQNFSGLPFIQIFRGHRRGRLVRHYFLISVILIGSGLITSGVVEIYFRYQESRENLALLQQEVASSGSFKRSIARSRELPGAGRSLQGASRPNTGLNWKNSCS